MNNKSINEYSNATLRLLPKGWVWVRLGEVSSVQGGYAFKSKDYKNDGIPLLRISNIKNNSIIFDEDTVFIDKKI
jgi:type I restriction enzyme S subunit